MNASSTKAWLVNCHYLPAGPAYPAWIYEVRLFAATKEEARELAPSRVANLEPELNQETLKVALATELSNLDGESVRRVVSVGTRSRTA